MSTLPRRQGDADCDEVESAWLRCFYRIGKPRLPRSRNPILKGPSFSPSTIRPREGETALWQAGSIPRNTSPGWRREAPSNVEDAVAIKAYNAAAPYYVSWVNARLTQARPLADQCLQQPASSFTF